MRALGVVEAEPAADSVFSGAGLTEGSGVEALLAQGAVNKESFVGKVLEAIGKGEAAPESGGPAPSTLV